MTLNIYQKLNEKRLRVIDRVREKRGASREERLDAVKRQIDELSPYLNQQ